MNVTTAVIVVAAIFAVIFAAAAAFIIITVDVAYDEIAVFTAATAAIKIAILVILLQGLE
jgi:hypothetical protein